MPINYKRYPPEWNIIVSKILIRAKCRCEICGLRNKSTAYSISLYVKENGRYKLCSIWFRSRQDAEREDKYNNIKPVKVVLTIAHLDHDEENWNIKMDRLKAMCQLCHLRYDAKEKYRRQLNLWNKTKGNLTILK